MEKLIHVGEQVDLLLLVEDDGRHGTHRTVGDLDPAAAAIAPHVHRARPLHDGLGLVVLVVLLLGMLQEALDGLRVPDRSRRV